MQRTIGPAWTNRGRPAAGNVTKRLAEDWLRSTLDEARRGVLPGQVRTGVTFADAAAEWLRYVEHDLSWCSTASPSGRARCGAWPPIR